MQQIKPIEIQKLYAELGLAPRTRHHVATVLKACLQAAVDIGKLLQANPAAAVKKPSADDSDIGQALEQDKITALVEGFRGSTLFDFTFLMAFTGMRRARHWRCAGATSIRGLRRYRSSGPSNTPRSMGCGSRFRSPSAASAPLSLTIPWSPC